MWKVTYSKQAVRTLRRVPKKLANQITDRINSLARDPYNTTENVTKLQGREGYRLRVGEWRVIYDLNDEELRILVLKVAPMSNEGGRNA